MLAMSILSDRELEALGSSSAEGSLFQTLFGISFGAALALGIVLMTVDITNPKAYASFWAAFLVSCLGSLCFGTLACVSFARSRNEVRLIKESGKERAS